MLTWLKMNRFKKYFVPLLTVGMLITVFSPLTYAQSVLDDIKAKLESEGISVVDYSSPDEWGALTAAQNAKWLSYLKDGKGGKFASLEAMAKGFETDFAVLQEVRRDLAAAEARKSGLTNQEDIDQANLDINLAKQDIDFQTKKIKDRIAGEILGNVAAYNSEYSTSLAIDENIKNLIFSEMDFYFNYRKWGQLPTRIVTALEEAGYEDLKQMVAKIGNYEVEQFPNFNDLLKEVGLENIRTALSQIEELSSDDVELILDSLQIVYATGESQIGLAARAIADAIKNIVIGIAVIWIIYAGSRMIFAQGNETVIEEQKEALIYAGIGLAAILLVGRGIDFLYGPAGVVRTDLNAYDARFSNEIIGIVTFIKAVIGSIAIAMIVMSGVRMLFASGQEDEITKQRTSLLWVGVGLVILAINQVVIENIFIIPIQQSDQIKSSNVVSIINVIGSVLQFILGFVGLIAFAALIYGAATMIMNYGNDEMVEKSKKIIRNALIGIVVIISAYVIVATLVVFK